VITGERGIDLKQRAAASSSPNLGNKRREEGRGNSNFTCHQGEKRRREGKRNAAVRK